MPSLTVSRQTAETLFIDTSDGPIIVEVSQARRGRVKLNVKAPSSVKIVRGELLTRRQQQEQQGRDQEPPPGRG